MMMQMLFVIQHHHLKSPRLLRLKFSQQAIEITNRLNLWINPEVIQKIWDGEIKLTYRAYQELDEFVTGARKMFHG